MSLAERTGWRDAELSARHRLWGVNVPMIDMDLIGLEYDRGRATAVIEYKHYQAPGQDPKHPSYVALAGFCTDARRPCFAVRYCLDDGRSYFQIRSLNAFARNASPPTGLLSEYQYVEFLYRLRGRVMPREVALLLSR